MTFTSSYTNHLIQQSQYYYGTPEMSPGLSGSFSGSFQGDGSELTGVGETIEALKGRSDIYDTEEGRFTTAFEQFLKNLLFVFF